MENESNSWKATKELGRSFTFAFSGLLYTLHSQRNMRFHIFFAIFATVFFVAFGLSFIERGILLIVICLVPAFEVINTSIESTVDHTSKEKHILVKHAKDTAAAAVLIIALLAMAIGGYILLPRFAEFFQNFESKMTAKGGIRVLMAFLVLISLISFWILRGIRYLFKPLLGLTAFCAGTGTMALCVYGKDPSAYVAITFLCCLELNAFARIEYETRIEKAWEDENLPFDTAGFKIILPATAMGAAFGVLLSAGSWALINNYFQ